MPVPIQSGASQTEQRPQHPQQQHPQRAGGTPAMFARNNRPTMSSRACSYQDTSRYRTSATAASGASFSGGEDGPVTASSVTAASDAAAAVKGDSLAGLVGSNTNSSAAAMGPAAPVRPALNRGFTREGWMKQLASGGPGGGVVAHHTSTPSAGGPMATPRGGAGTFAHGYFSMQSGKSTPVHEFGAAGPPPSVWGPASPSLAGAFELSHDVVGPSNPEAESDNVPKQTFAFTIHAARHLSAVSRPGTPTDESGESIPESVTETANRYQEGKENASATPATGRKIMVAVDGADTDGLATLDWACKNVVQPGDTLTVIRVVRELKGFKGGYAAASDMLGTIETRARAEADRVTCHAIRQLGREGKKAVDIYVKYRVGEPRAAIREVVGSQRPMILVVGNSRQRVAAGSLPQRGPATGPASSHGSGQTNIFFHGGHGTFVPEHMHGQVQVVTAQ